METTGTIEPRRAALLLARLAAATLAIAGQVVVGVWYLGIGMLVAPSEAFVVFAGAFVLECLVLVWLVARHQLIAPLAVLAWSLWSYVLISAAATHWDWVA